VIYLFNTPILTAYGDFRLSGPIDTAEARPGIAGGFTSAIGHEASAALLSVRIGVAGTAGIRRGSRVGPGPNRNAGRA